MVVKSSIVNIRSKAEKREIVQYLLLRERVLGLSERKSKTEYVKSINKARRSEILMLISIIKKDTIRAKVKRLHQQIHIENDYAKKLKHDALEKDDVGEEDE